MEWHAGKTERKKISVPARLGVSTLMFLAAGCASVATMPTDYGVEHVAGYSKESKPSWLDNIDAYQKAHETRIYFVGMAIRASDLEGGRTDATANAMSQIANSVKAAVHNLYIGARARGDDGNASFYTADMQRAIEAGTLREAKGVITGAAPDFFWWQKTWVQAGPGEPVRYSFDVYVLVSQSRADYEKTVFRTLNGLQSSVDLPKAGAVIKTMKDLWLRKRGV